MQIGFYVDNASLTFKVSETSDKGYYSQKKIRYYPLLTLQFQGIYSEMISVGRKWSNVTFGISEVLLLPIGSCSCSYPETSDGSFPYLAIGIFCHCLNKLVSLKRLKVLNPPITRVILFLTLKR